MNQISEEIFNKYQARKTRKQKIAFFDYLKGKLENKGFKVKKEEGGNIVVGDVSKAKILLTAHYDTSPSRLINSEKQMYPIKKNTMRVCSITFLVFFVLVMLCAGLINFNPIIGYITIVVLVAISAILLYMYFYGITNSYTANDNTSGIIAICEMLFSDEIKQEEIAYIFFNNEENGRWGSKKFEKLHKNELGKKLLINLDCIGIGNDIFCICSDKTMNDYGNYLKQSFCDRNDKTIHLINVDQANHTSDDKIFREYNAIGIITCEKIIKRKKEKYILRNIHTVYDKVETAEDKKKYFENIQYIKSSIINYINTNH